MEFTHDSIRKWFYSYFAEFTECNGNPKKVPNMEKYFTEDLQFISYILGVKRPDDREGLLNTMVHPGLLESLEPEEIVIDEKNKSVAVILKVQFKEESTGTVFPLKHNCAVYNLINDKKGNMKINKITYFTEHRSPDEPDMKSLMKKYRQQALGS
ncbi:MAG TPA: hypothetical protein G4O16_04955 [Dehalococcoidia bacterium]|nr:hypothetical protein [Dehalococcoidia bacterium]